MSNSFFVPKASGGFRLVINLKHLNKHFEFPKVKFEDLRVLQNAALSVQFGISVDVSDAYHHLRIHASLEQYF